MKYGRGIFYILSPKSPKWGTCFVQSIKLITPYSLPHLGKGWGWGNYCEAYFLIFAGQNFYERNFKYKGKADS